MTVKDEIAFIKWREALRLYVYDDANGERWKPGKKVYGHLTCGWGHVCTPEEALKLHTGFAESVAEQFFKEDYAEAAAIVDKYKFPFTKKYQRGAIISLVFNAGEGPLKKSVGMYLKKGDWVNAANAMSWYIRDDNSVEQGLVRRRVFEMLYLLTGTFPERWE